VREAGNIEKLSIAVMIDGTYKITEDGKKEYTPRSDEEMNKFTSIIKAATGYDESRGDTITVTNVAFDTSYQEKERLSMEKLARQEFLKYLIKYILIGVSILILFLILRSSLRGISLKKRRKEEEITPAEEAVKKKKEAILPEEELIRRQISELVEKNSEETVQIIRIWLREGKNGDRLRKSYG